MYALLNALQVICYRLWFKCRLFIEYYNRRKANDGEWTNCTMIGIKRSRKSFAQMDWFCGRWSNVKTTKNVALNGVKQMKSTCLMTIVMMMMMMTMICNLPATFLTPIAASTTPDPTASTAFPIIFIFVSDFNRTLSLVHAVLDISKQVTLERKRLNCFSKI